MARQQRDENLDVPAGGEETLQAGEEIFEFQEMLRWKGRPFRCAVPPLERCKRHRTVQSMQG